MYSNRIKHIYYNSNFDDLLNSYNDFTINFDTRTKIEDVDNFILQLKRKNLYSKELEEFIDNYLKFDND
jgi:hypothetical protein